MPETVNQSQRKLQGGEADSVWPNLFMVYDVFKIDNRDTDLRLGAVYLPCRGDEAVSEGSAPEGVKSLTSEPPSNTINSDKNIGVCSHRGCIRGINTNG